MTRGTSAIALPNSKAYLFQGTNFARLDFESGQAEQGGLSIAAQWPGLRTDARDAGVYFGSGKAYFFYGNEYVRYELGSNGAEGVEPEYLPPNPAFTTTSWPGLWAEGVHAAMNYGNGKLYFMLD